MIAIISAVRDEVSDYLAEGGFTGAGDAGGSPVYRSRRGPRVAVVTAGMGKERAIAATRAAIEALRPGLVICTGFSGGLRAGLETGDVVVAGAVWGVDGPPGRWSTDSAARMDVSGPGSADELAAALEREGRRAVKADCLTVPRVSLDPVEKARIGRDFLAGVADMESFWVAATAAEHGVRTAVGRVVLDPVHEALPPFVERVAEQGGRGRLRHAARYLIGRPAGARGLLRLAAQARLARASVASYLAAATRVEGPVAVG